MQQSIQTILAAIGRELEEIDRDIDDLIKSSPVWREKEHLLRTFKGVGPVTARIVVAKLPELGKVNRQEISCLEGCADSKLTYSDDTEAAWVRKGNRPHYGYKMHMVTDRAGFVLGGHVNPANMSDTGWTHLGLRWSRKIDEKS